jgi:hypothetical protein
VVVEEEVLLAQMKEARVVMVMVVLQLAEAPEVVLQAT